MFHIISDGMDTLCSQQIFNQLSLILTCASLLRRVIPSSSFPAVFLTLWSFFFSPLFSSYSASCYFKEIPLQLQNSLSLRLPSSDAIFSLHMFSRASYCLRRPTMGWVKWCCFHACVKPCEHVNCMDAQKTCVWPMRRKNTVIFFFKTRDWCLVLKKDPCDLFYLCEVLSVLSVFTVFLRVFFFFFYCTLHILSPTENSEKLLAHI